MVADSKLKGMTMNNIVKFDTGCRKCIHLVRIGKNSFLCGIRVHLDDSDVVPIRNGQKTEDWNICNGEHYKKYD